MRAQATFELGVHEDDVYTWKITELNRHNFERTFGFNPFFEVGDQLRIKIDSIVTPTDTGDYTIVADFWDYGSDFNQKGVIKYYTVPSTPTEYKDNLFILTPTDRFLQDALETLPSSYTVEGSTITKLMQNYSSVLEYHPRGVVLTETYIDDDGIVLIKVEGNFRLISLGTSFMGIMLVSVIFIVLMILKNKKLEFKSG